MTELNIKQLHSGGIITNYYCSSQCKHCLYACSPKWQKKYLDPDLARKMFRKIKELNCSSVHIGGGEPMLNDRALINVLKVACEENIFIEYIETNSSWFKDVEQVEEILLSLKEVRVETLLISMSPFHNEFIPFKKIKAVLNTCERVGMSIFPWISEFYPEINSFDDTTIHSLKEYQLKFGETYIKNIPSRYWIHFGGRALETFRKVFPSQSLETILEESIGCSELTDTSHFHFDLFGNYVPGLCSGFAIQYQDLGKPLDLQKYFFLNMVYSGGIQALYQFARNIYDYKPNKKYLSKCDLCLDIRLFFVAEKKIKSLELQPLEFYSNVRS